MKKILQNVDLEKDSVEALAQKIKSIEASFLPQPFIGIQYVTLDSATASTLKWSGEGGVLIDAPPSQNPIMPGSPAAAAGLKKGDIILVFDGKPVKDRTHFQSLVAQKQPNTEVPLEIWRDGKKQTLKLTLGELAQYQ